MQERHRLLQRQLKRFFGNLETMPESFSESWHAFIEAIDDAYRQADADKLRLERSLEISSQELLQANSELQALLQTVENQVAERTAALTQANANLEVMLEKLQCTQAQLVQTEKMSSLGQLVAGIAHEINNPVNFIHSNLTFAHEYTQTLLNLIRLHQRHCPNPSLAMQTELAALTDIDLDFLVTDFTKLLASMQIGTDRIRAIVLSLRNFSRLDEAETKAIDIHEGLESTLLILQHRLKPKAAKSGIQVLKHYDPLPRVECFAGQLNQVFMNILTNAIDALEQPSNSSSIPDYTDQTHEEIKGSSNQITIHTSAINSQWVQITIADNGPGIPPAIQQRIFDPFFTTKPIGKGTGMGMSISYQIITERHGGKLQCFSTPGKGTEFVIQIPIRQQVTVSTPQTRH